LYALADCYHQWGKEDLSYEFYSRAIEVYPGFANYLPTASADDRIRSAKLYEKAAQISVASRGAHDYCAALQLLRAAKVWDKSGDRDKAEIDYRQSREIDPNISKYAN
jgi:tetratricopeptide (TPR) repeat protein